MSLFYPIKKEAPGLRNIGYVFGKTVFGSPAFTV
jgi:hypothetical protein